MRVVGVFKAINAGCYDVERY